MNHQSLVLIVEDDRKLGCLISTALENGGYTSLLVGNRAEARQIIEESPPALILLDYDLLSDNLLHRAQANAIPVVMLSAYEVSRAMNSDDMTRTPFDLKHLLTLIMNCLPREEKGYEREINRWP